MITSERAREGVREREKERVENYCLVPFTTHTY